MEPGKAEPAILSRLFYSSPLLFPKGKTRVLPGHSFLSRFSFSIMIIPFRCGIIRIGRQFHYSQEYEYKNKNTEFHYFSFQSPNLQNGFPGFVLFKQEK